MRYLVILAMSVAALWSIESFAADLDMEFVIKPFDSSGSLEKSVVWNPSTQEATVRLGLIPKSIDPILSDAVVNVSTAKSVEIFPVDFPEMSEGCDTVSQYQFEYRAGLPDYLMYLTLKGPNCQRLAENIELYNTRLRFLGVSTPTNPIDLAVKISR
ncbi:MAG TPA: hypothetical protein VN132_00480 [Bdellovibrio sp.]|nr:hypothetical protein [Bdellovibrio sp.]